MQDLVMTLHTETSKKYRRYIVKIGIGKERSSHTPWEVTAENGSVLTNMEKVLLGCWKTDYKTLLNPHSKTQVPLSDPCPPHLPGMPLMDT